MSSTDRAFTDIDEYVTLRLAEDGTVTVAISAAGFRRPTGEIARLIKETAQRLPHPAATGDAAVQSGIEAIGQLHQAMATGGYEAFAEMMRRRLGIEAPASTLARTPDLDQALASHLDGILTAMRDTSTGRRESTDEAPTAEAASGEGDIAVTTSAERIIAGVRIDPAARKRGAEGLAEALTSLIARARAELRGLAEHQARHGVPDDVAHAMDSAPEDGERAGRTADRLIDEVTQTTESLQRKAGKE